MSVREAREVALACGCHLGIRLALRALPFRTFLRLARVHLPLARRPLAFSSVQRIVRDSGRLCRGSCLTESIVMRWLAARHGFELPRLTIGVARDGGALRAHAWTDGSGDGFVPLWTEPRREARGTWQA